MLWKQPTVVRKPINIRDGQRRKSSCQAARHAPFIEGILGRGKNHTLQLPRFRSLAPPAQSMRPNRRGTHRGRRPATCRIRHFVHTFPYRLVSCLRMPQPSGACAKPRGPRPCLYGNANRVPRRIKSDEHSLEVRRRAPADSAEFNMKGKKVSFA